ncbi:MAG: PHP domain-containing protein, partial [Pseudomonadota bacterium]
MVDFSKDFIHLRNRSAYSLACGAISIQKLVDLALAHQMPATAISDIDHMFGVMEFAALASKTGLQPLIGCDFAVEIDVKTKHGDDISQKGRLLAIALNEQGYVNLMALVSQKALKSFEHGHDDEFMLGLQDLKTYHHGLIILDGGWGGPAGQALLNGQFEQAKSMTKILSEIFKDHYYIELMRTKRKQEKICEKPLIEMAYHYHLPLVASNDCHYPDASFWQAHEALLCINRDQILDEENKIGTGEHYFKSSAQMRALFKDIPEACNNTLSIAQRCAFMPTPRRPLLPKITLDKNLDSNHILAKKAKKGLKTRLKNAQDQDEKSD